MNTSFTIRPSFLIALGLTILLAAIAVPGCYERRYTANNGNGRGGTDWRTTEHGDPLLGPGPKNPNGKDNRPGAR